MDAIKTCFTQYIHRIIDEFNLPYEVVFDFFKLKNCLS